MKDADPTDAFERQRERLFAVAYRMLGSVAEAEDAVQDTWLRWQGTDPHAIASSGAWLCTVVTRICLDRLGSARARREVYTGPWLPEPVRTESPADPESISMAFLVLLERLGPVERAAYLLHEVFDYSHAEVGAILEREEAACRQIVHRARRRLRDGRPRFTASREAHARILRAFADALVAGDLAGIERTLAEDATLTVDSGGKVRGAARRPLEGAVAIAKFFATLLSRLPFDPAQAFDLEEVNGWPALVGRLDGVANVALSVETNGTHIVSIHNVVNPDKLERL